jgi:hypothetical protein
MLVLNIMYLSINAARSVRAKAWVCGRSHTEIVGLNPTGNMDICPL